MARALAVAGIRRKVALALEFEAIQDLGIEVCRNDVCLAGTLVELSEPTRSGEGFGVTLEPGDGEIHPFVDAVIWLGESQGYRLEVMYWPHSHAELQDGDRYALTLTQPDGTALLQLDETVEYEETYPNGVECDVTPCRSVAFEVAP